MKMSALPSDIVFQRAKMEDAIPLWILRNNGSIRRLQFDSSEFALESHLKWLDKALQDDSFLMFVAREFGRVIGQVSYRRDGDVIVIGYYVASERWGNGIGSEMIRETLKAAYAKFPVDIVEAQVMVCNERSERCIVSAGFRFVRAEEIKGKTCSIFEHRRPPVGESFAAIAKKRGKDFGVSLQFGDNNAMGPARMEEIRREAVAMVGSFSFDIRGDGSC